MTSLHLRRESQRRLQKTVGALLHNHPFFGALALRLPLVESTKRKTLGTNGERIYYNPEWVSETSGDDLKEAVARVVWACTLKHHTRRGNRSYNKWQMASQEVTTPMLRAEGLTEEQGGLDMSVEAAYEFLPDIPEDGSASSGGEGSGDSEGPPSYDPNGKGEIMDSPARGDQEGSGDAAQQAALQAEEQKWDEAAHQAVSLAKAQGKDPGKAAEMLRDGHHSRVDWREVLRRFMVASAKNDYTWTMPNRRYVDMGMYLPSLRSESMPPIVFAMDTSGSMNSQVLDNVWAEIKEATREVNPEEVIVIQADHAVQAVDRYDALELPEKIVVKGRGGTSFQPVFEAVEDMGRPPVCLIYLTDLGVWNEPWDEFEPSFPVMWAAYDEPSDDMTPPWGERIDVT